MAKRDHSVGGLPVKIRFDHRKNGRRTFSEHLWAQPSGLGRYRLRNTPFHFYDVSWDDEVRAIRVRGELVFVDVAARGGHSTYWLEVPPEQKAAFPRFWARLKALGCGYEGDGRGLYAVDVPPSASIHEVLTILEEGHAADVWRFEEAHCAHPRFH